jgi:hypothetical protein
VTRGPKGRNVVLERRPGTDDHRGQRVGSEGNRAKDKFENMGAQMVKESRQDLGCRR